ncbi:MAG: multicopper oxidase domain-containing protein, partial [Rhodothermales bacterium]|nr:multicopper oxidase domain-containing protein [Rhodothermales bacterium]
MRSLILSLLLVAVVASPLLAQSLHPRLLDAGVASDLPRVIPNDNRRPAGALRDGVHEVALEVVWADWRMETPDRPGLKVAAIAEAGAAPMIPAPLLRVEAGTRVRVQVHNSLTDSTITVFGLQRRPATTADSLMIPPGETGTVTFEAGAPGTYLYHVRLGAPAGFNRGAEREQLAGAFVVDPVGGSPPDRILVLNIWSQEVDTTVAPPFGFLVALTINGLSWPFTEREHPAVGDTLRWRIVNASQRNHPMHLHGFFYDVTSRGGVLEDAVYARRDRRTVVTEFMRGRTTMGMEWVPKRPGNWVFHCHLAFHVSPMIRLPGAAHHDPDGKMIHMAGLVIGVEVQPGPTDLVEEGEPAHVRLYVNEYGAEAASPMGFTLDPTFVPDSTNNGRPGELLIFKQFQPTYVTVENRMTSPTGVHWHGLEIDSWADGVPGYSASNGKVSPMIAPGEAFTYKLSLMRPGTFIYHSHLDDIRQITSGLYGPLLVLPPGETFDPQTDHVYTVSWKTPDPQAFTDVELNGGMEQPTMHVEVGETHRLRVINIAPAGNITARMTRDEAPVPLLAFAKDGAELPDHQKRPIEVSPAMGVGETADFLFTLAGLSPRADTLARLLAR